MNIINKAKLSKILALLFVCGFAPAIYAAPGTLSDSPLFLSTSVEPNIFWTVDDSGSMDWELLTSASGSVSGRPSIDDSTYHYYILPSPNNDYDKEYIDDNNPDRFPYTIASNNALSGAWKARNSSYNVLYYNPEITYVPWAGSDAAGLAMYGDANAAAALADPTNPSAGVFDLTNDLTYKNGDVWYELVRYGYYWYYVIRIDWYDDTIYPARYYKWTDLNGNGEVDDADYGADNLVNIKSANAPFTGGVDRIDCAAAPTCTYVEEIQNFANWYQYYRKREYVAKAAVGNIVQGNSSARMGMQVFNGDLVSNATSMSVTADKIALLNSSYGLSMPCTTSSCPGTPARTSLKSVGDLFEGDSSPILGSAAGGTCQQNFNILLTDGYWNGSDPSVGDADSDNNTDFDGGYYADIPYTAQEIKDGENVGSTLADIAMHYYERDLATALDNRVPTTPGVDEADHQHLVTYTVAFGVEGTLDPETQDPLDSDPGTFWPNPTSDSKKVDDLWHAAYNSRGLYLNAQNPGELTNSLETALENIDDRSGSAAAVAFNTNTLTTGSAVFLVLFNSNRWSGNVYKYALDPITGAVSDTISWEASSVLDSRNLTTNSRAILTNNGTDGVPFQWANLTVAQKDDLKTNPAGGADSDTKGEARLDYLRGDRSNENAGYNFRTRSSRLGDIVHSNPVYVGAPSMEWPSSAPFPVDANSYYTWENISTVKNRVPMLYVGANDGMMHGFRSSDGAEVVSYIPSNLFSTDTNDGLHYLADPAYLHRYYVDLPPTVTDAYIKVDPAGSTEWRTLLLGGQRGGGKGLFALDITYPTDFSEANAANTVLWEFTEADLGYTYSEPTVALMNNGKWAAIFGNGYNNTGSGEANLFIVYLEGGLDGVWTSGTDYLKISTGTGTSGDINGLSTPAVIDTDGDGTADRVYAGDIHGDLWAFDLEDSNPTKWVVAYKQGSTYKPLYDGLSTQPITVEPVVARHPDPDVVGSPGYMVYFGTGQYLVSGDKATTDSQSFYGVWDEGTKELGRSSLVEQTFETGFASNVRVLSENPVDYSSKNGWYIDLPASTERVVVNPAIRGDIVYFNTLISSIDPCSYGGSGWLMGVDMVTGGRPDPENVVFDTNGDGVVDASDLLTNGDSSVSGAGASGIQYAGGIPAESAFLGDYQYTPGTNTDDGGDIEVNKIQDLGDNMTGRLSWEEISLD